MRNTLTSFGAIYRYEDYDAAGSLNWTPVQDGVVVLSELSSWKRGAS